MSNLQWDQIQWQAFKFDKNFLQLKITVIYKSTIEISCENQYQIQSATPIGPICYIVILTFFSSSR
jgi:hypothetical protein